MSHMNRACHIYMGSVVYEFSCCVPDNVNQRMSMCACALCVSVYDMCMCCICVSVCLCS